MKPATLGLKPDLGTSHETCCRLTPHNHDDISLRYSAVGGSSKQEDQVRQAACLNLFPSFLRATDLLSPHVNTNSYTSGSPPGGPILSWSDMHSRQLHDAESWRDNSSSRASRSFASTPAILLNLQTPNLGDPFVRKSQAETTLFRACSFTCPVSKPPPDRPWC